MRCALLALSLAGCIDSRDPCASGLAPIGVSNKTVVDNVIHFDVEYSGGCKTHDFSVWPATGITATSSHVILEIHHYDHGDSCEASVMHPLNIDLSQLPTDSATIDLEQRSVDVPSRFGSVEWTRSPITTLPPGETVLAIDDTCLGH